MGIKEYAKKKREAYQKWKSKRDDEKWRKERTRELQHKLDMEALEIEMERKLERQEAENKRLKKGIKYKRMVDEAKKMSKEKDKPKGAMTLSQHMGGIGMGVSKMSKGGESSLLGGMAGSKPSRDAGVFGGGSLFGNGEGILGGDILGGRSVFDQPTPRKKKRRGGKKKTIKVKKGMTLVFK